MVSSWVSSLSFFFLTGISLQKSVTFLRRKPGFIEAGLSAENRDVPPLMIVPAVAVWPKTTDRGSVAFGSMEKEKHGEVHGGSVGHFIIYIHIIITYNHIIIIMYLFQPNPWYSKSCGTFHPSLGDWIQVFIYFFSSNWIDRCTL